MSLQDIVRTILMKVVMIEKIKSIFNDLMTGKDGATHDMGKWSWLLSMITVIGSAVWNSLHGTVIELLTLAQALGVVVAAHGAALWAKKDTEPQ